MDIIEVIRDLFRQNGDSRYGFEEVSQLEHALQAAWAAEKEQAGDAQIAAALLHDVGHLLHDLPDDATEEGIDDQHERLGQQWLEPHFGPEVTEPVRLHVVAKRYLCAVESTYLGTLSLTSVQSLELQGGPFDDARVQQFEQTPYFRQAVALRRWDDEAKVVGLQTPSTDHFLQYVKAVAITS
jgi:phosphonate degradation associated HDIG domain protein